MLTSLCIHILGLWHCHLNLTKLPTTTLKQRCGPTGSFVKDSTEFCDTDVTLQGEMLVHVSFDVSALFTNILADVSLGCH